MKVLIVDDSVVFRSQIKAAIGSCPEFNHIEVAPNGVLALGKLERGDFDLLILDLEMPEMGGIETLEQIRQKNIKVHTIVFSGQSARGADTTIKALEAGANDFVTKPANVNSLEEALEHIKEQLIPRALQFISNNRVPEKVAVGQTTSAPAAPVPQSQTPNKSNWHKINVNMFSPKICVVGSSTGGPVALKTLLGQLRPPLKIPILITQHMPPTFTSSLAKSIQELTQIETAEAKHMETLQNRIYIAPGDYHMTLVKQGDDISISLDQRQKRCSVRPAVDYLFESAAEIFQRKAFAMVLTGMGSDGKDGSIAIKNAGGCVVIQDEETSTVWGMPGSVFKVDAFDEIKSIDACEKIISKMVKGIL